MPAAIPIRKQQPLADAREGQRGLRRDRAMGAPVPGARAYLLERKKELRKRMKKAGAGWLTEADDPLLFHASECLARGELISRVVDQALEAGDYHAATQMRLFWKDCAVQARVALKDLGFPPAERAKLAGDGGEEDEFDR